MSTREQVSMANAGDAIAVLTADHQKVKQLFLEFRKMKDSAPLAAKEALVQEICTELLIHAELEEEVFYPAVREALNDDVLVDEAEAEHNNAKDVIEELQAMNPADPAYNAKIIVLGENIDRHILEEQTVMFPKVKKSRLDLLALGEELSTLRHTKRAQFMTGNGSPHGSNRSSARF